MNDADFERFLRKILNRRIKAKAIALEEGIDLKEVYARLCALEDAVAQESIKKSGTDL